MHIQLRPRDSCWTANRREHVYHARLVRDPSQALKRLAIRRRAAAQRPQIQVETMWYWSTHTVNTKEDLLSRNISSSGKLVYPFHSNENLKRPHGLPNEKQLEAPT